jgi:hypothetical protein
MPLILPKYVVLTELDVGFYFFGIGGGV